MEVKTEITHLQTKTGHQVPNSHQKLGEKQGADFSQGLP